MFSNFIQEMFINKKIIAYLKRIAVYLFLIVIGFCFLLPLIYMLSYSLKSPLDLLNTPNHWLPTEIYTGNFERAWKVLSYTKTLITTAFVSITPAIVQMLVTSLIGYGFARYQFPGKYILLVVVMLTFIIPPQVVVIPRYLLFHRIGILGSLLAYIVPSGLGQGINSGIFILIFYQTFRAMPVALIEAAQLDGATEFEIFWRISAPLSISGYIITFLFSLVWYWNETYLAAIYFGDSLTTLQLELQKFVATFNNLYPSGGNQLEASNIAIELAATLLTIIPLLIIYFVAQKWFVESIERSGITGE